MIIKTAMIVAATFAFLGTAQADVCVPVDGVVDCASTATNGRYNRSCRTPTNTPTAEGTFFLVLRTPADENESYVVHFAGFDVDECTGGFNTCVEVTDEGDLRIGGLSNVSDTVQRVRVSRVDESITDIDPVCELGLTVTF